MSQPEPRPSAIDHHAAHKLAAKLRAAGVYTSGKDVLGWPPHTVRLALAWVAARDRGYKVLAFADYMGAHLPPPSQHGWLPMSPSAD